MNLNGVIPMLKPDANSVDESDLPLSTSGHLDDAIGDVRGRLSRDADNGHLWQLLGNLYFARKEFTLAQTALECASVLVPLSARSQVTLARCYDSAGHSEAASAIFLHVATMRDLDLDLLEPLAAGLGHCGHLELALNVCRSAARRIPDSAAPLLGIVHYMYRLRRPVEHILPVMARAVSLDSENVELRIALAWLLNKADRAAEAADVLKQVPVDEIRCAGCLERLMHICEQAGDESAAAKCAARLQQLMEE